MACTEDAIDAHYSGQIAALGRQRIGPARTVEQFRAEELEHRDGTGTSRFGIGKGRRSGHPTPVLTAAIKAGAAPRSPSASGSKTD
jgi:3-demethoxyubiquinol 3-hydroxylase